MHLTSKRLSVEVATMEGNPSTRFEHLPYVSSVLLDSRHSFLSAEKTKAGDGTRGVGLMHGFLNSSEMDDDNTSGFYPVIGTGIAKIPADGYSIRINYPCDFAEVNLISSNPASASFRLYQNPFCGISYEIIRTFALTDDSLHISTKMTNLGERILAAKQYCHNFFLFDGIPNDSSYQVNMMDCRDLQVVRGSVILGKEWYRPYEFDERLGTMALTYSPGDEDDEVLKISNMITKTSVEIENHFQVLERYHWHSPWCICPESFVKIRLESGQSIDFSRTYRFLTHP